MNILIKNRQKPTKINQQKIKRDSAALLLLLGLKDAELSILFVNDRQMKELNHKYRGIDRTTDVLSFPQVSPEFGRLRRLAEARVRSSEKKMFPTFNSKLKTPNFILGDVVINLQAAKRQAPEHGLSFTGELRWILIHGILHLIGYDHERSKYAERKMWTKERELLKYMAKSS